MFIRYPVWDCYLFVIPLEKKKHPKSYRAYSQVLSPKKCVLIKKTYSVHISLSK